MKTKNFIVVGLLALAFVLSPVITNAQTPVPVLLPGDPVANLIDPLVAHHSGDIYSLMAQIAKLQIQVWLQPCQQPGGAIYNFQTGAVCATNNTNRPPSISGVRGPTTLEVNGKGTWSVIASDPENGPLSYSVRWGDETTAGGIQQTATFTHSYSNAGTYHPTFTVTDNAGQSAQTSLSVVVGDTKSQGTLNVYVRDATSGGFRLLIPVRVAIYQNGLYLTSQQTQETTNGPVVFRLLPGSYRLEVGSELVAYNYNNQTFSIQSGEVKNISVDLVRDPAYTCYSNGGTWNYTTNECISNATTTPVIIPTIISSNPPNGAIDVGAGIGTGGMSRATDILLSMSPSQSPTDFPASAFSVSSTRTDAPISITKVTHVTELDAGPNVILLWPEFDRNTFPGERIRITHKLSNSSICLGFLPGDATQDGRFNSTDISALRYWVSTSTPDGATQPLYKTDINRDGVFNQADLDKARELLSDPNTIKTLPPCPPPPPAGGLGSATRQSQMANALSSLTSLLQQLQILQQSIAR